MLSYPSTISLSTDTLNHLTHLVRAHRRAIGSHWRVLSCRDQALLVLAHLRNGDTYAQADILLLADSGYIGVADAADAANGVITPYKNARNKHSPTRSLSPGKKAANTALSATRAPGERGFATLKNWHILHRVRACPYRVGTLAKAVLTLEHSLGQ